MCPHLQVPTPVPWLPWWPWSHPLLGGELGEVGDARCLLGVLSALQPDSGAQRSFVPDWMLGGLVWLGLKTLGCWVTVRGEGLCVRFSSGMLVDVSWLFVFLVCADCI